MSQIALPQIFAVENFNPNINVGLLGPKTRKNLQNQAAQILYAKYD